jgi:hypothetical protein
VSDKGRPWKEGDPLRRGALEFIRLPVCGRSWSESWRDLLNVAGDDAAATFGVFIKILEIAGDHEAEKRGRLLGRGDVPMESAALAKATGLCERDTTKALEILCDPRVGWLSIVPGISGSSRNFRELPESPGISVQSIQSSKQEECVNSRGDVAVTSIDDEEKPMEVDPLAELPRLASAFEKINAAIQTAHPRAKLPRSGTKADTEARETLARLVRIDDYSENDMADVLHWTLKDDHADAKFWRQQVQGIRGLRRRKTGDSLSKFDKIAEAFERARGGSSGDRATSETLRAVIAAHGAARTAQ